MSKDYSYWKSQIESAKEALNSYRKDASECIKEYTAKDRNYNIFFSNVQTLDSNLNLSNPKADIQRRFLKNIESNKVKSNAYAEVAKIMTSAVDYVVDMADVDKAIQADTHHTDVVGRGIAWVEYNPTIEADENGVESVKSRDITVEPLKYDEFLCSSAEKECDIWWVARRHLLTRNDIYKRFGYSPDDSELSYTPSDRKDDETMQKRGEVWEIWDKSEKQRIFLLLNSAQKEPLEVSPDPYKLECFFPCDSLYFVLEENSMIPVPEYKIYRKQALLLETICRKIAEIEDEVKYVIATGSQEKGIAQDITKAKNGTVISIPTNDVAGGVAQMLTTIPCDSAVALLEHLEAQKQRVVQNIYELTGISDIMRGATDPRETASAQMIKGVFGSLRFQERQKAVQNHRKKIYRIIAEIIAEHYDPETLAEMTGTQLPSQEDKARLDLQVKQIQAQGGQVPPELASQYESQMNMPTWDDVLAILRSDRLRNYTVDVETTSTAFDDKQQQTEAIDKITQAYIQMTQLAAQLNSPELVKGFMPIMKLNLNNCKVSSSIHRQLEEALDGAYKEMDAKSKQPAPPTPEQIKAQTEINIKSAELKSEQEKHYLEQQTEQKRLDIEMVKAQTESEYKKAEIAIKQQEQDRLEAELQAEIYLEQEKLDNDPNIDVNIRGGVKDLVR